MLEAHDLGKRSEEIAQLFLLSQGYTILERNWRYRHLEIDIIAETSDITAIVEVKARRKLHMGRIEEQVNPKKIHRLIRAANAYALTRKNSINFRFDLLTIYWSGDDYKLIHTLDAFYHF